MNKSMIAALAIFLVLAAIVAPFISQNYYPHIKLTSPDGITLTQVYPPLNFEAGCLDTINTQLATLKKACPQCAIEQSGCARQPQPGWREGLQGQATPYYTVYTRKLITLIEAPTPLAETTCQGTLAALQQQGVAPVACLPPTRNR